RNCPLAIASEPAEKAMLWSLRASNAKTWSRRALVGNLLFQPCMGSRRYLVRARMHDLFNSISLAMTLTVAAFSGSTRKESYNTKLVKAFRKLAPQDVEVSLVEIGGLPLMNEDLEKSPPQPILDLHQAIERADAILLVTPEYNRSYSPALKNA